MRFPESLSTLLLNIYANMLAGATDEIATDAAALSTAFSNLANWRKRALSISVDRPEKYPIRHGVTAFEATKPDNQLKQSFEGNDSRENMDATITGFAKIDVGLGGNVHLTRKRDKFLDWPEPEDDTVFYGARLSWLELEKLKFNVQFAEIPFQENEFNRLGNTSVYQVEHQDEITTQFKNPNNLVIVTWVHEMCVICLPTPRR